MPETLPFSGSLQHSSLLLISQHRFHTATEVAEGANQWFAGMISILFWCGEGMEAAEVSPENFDGRVLSTPWLVTVIGMRMITRAALLCQPTLLAVHFFWLHPTIILYATRYTIWCKHPRAEWTFLASLHDIIVYLKSPDNCIHDFKIQSC